MSPSNNWSALPLDSYVISLEKMERRRSRIRNIFSELGIKYRFFDAMDGDDAIAVQDAFVCRPNSALRIYVARERPITSRELACSISHMRAIRHAYEAGLQKVLVLEDDIDIGSVTPTELSAIVKMMPSNASYLQLSILPASTVKVLSEHYIDSGSLFAKKKDNPATLFSDVQFADFTCHCTAAYIITRSGMENICKKYFDGARVVFPCFDHEVTSNVGLVADKFIYQAAADSDNPGYACCMPLFATEAQDSLLHPDHIDDHRAGKNTVDFYRKLITETGLNLN